MFNCSHSSLPRSVGGQRLRSLLPMVLFKAFVEELMGDAHKYFKEEVIKPNIRLARIL